MSRLWWVRHGPTHEKTCLGWRDVPVDLSDQDRINRVASYLPEDALFVSSDLQRARLTAKALSKGRVLLDPDPRLREFNFGAWDGLDFQTIAARDPVLSRAFWENPGDLKAPMGESWDDVSGRVASAVDQLCAAYPDSHLVLVAHMGVIMSQIQRATSCTPYQALGHQIDNFSVTDMTLSHGQWQIGRINHHP